MNKDNLTKNIIIILTFILIFGTHLRFNPYDTDIWIHLVAGKVMDEQGKIPQKDVLTFTAQDQDWSSHEWIYQKIQYTLYLLFGLKSILFLKALLVTLAMWLIFQLTKKYNFYVSIISTIIISFVITKFSSVRPHTVSWIFLPLTILLIKQKKEWFLPLMILIWGNLHPLHLLGLVIITAYLGEKFLSTKDRKYVAIIIACVVASAINPQGMGVFGLPFKITSPFIREWQPFSPQGIYFYIYSALILLGVFAIFTKKSKISEIALFLLITYMGYSSRRHVAQAFIILPLIIIPKLSLTKKEIIKINETKSRAMIAIISVLIIMSITLSDAFHTDFPWETLPNEEVDIIKEYQIKGNIFNEYAYGSYLELELYPDNLVYIDPRAETMPEDLMLEYYELGAKRPQDILGVLNKYNVTIAIVEHVMGVGNYLVNSPDWKLIYLNEIRASFVRKTNATESVPEFDISNSPYVQIRSAS